MHILYISKKKDRQKNKVSVHIFYRKGNSSAHSAYIYIYLKRRTERKQNVCTYISFIEKETTVHTLHIPKGKDREKTKSLYVSFIEKEIAVHTLNKFEEKDREKTKCLYTYFL